MKRSSLPFLFCLLFLTVVKIQGELPFKRPLTCNERMRHGPRGVAQAIAAVAGCVVLYKSRTVLQKAAEVQTTTAFESGKKYASVGLAVSICAGWVYYFASSAAHSLKIFFTDDKEVKKTDTIDTIFRTSAEQSEIQ